jgi:hypothetical protein
MEDKQVRSRIPARLRTARLAVSVAFFVNGALLASWVPHIPSVQTKLALGNGALGLALLLIAVGAVAALLLPAGSSGVSAAGS